MNWTTWRRSLALASLAVIGFSSGSNGQPLLNANSHTGSRAENVTIEVSDNSGECAHLNDFFSELLYLTNKARKDAGLKPLRISYPLGQSAQNYAEDLATQNFFSHQGKDGSTLSSRVEATGYDFAAAGENIAAGQQTAQAVFDGWMNSAGHRKNILAADYTEVGFGMFDATGSSDYGKYWVQNFGKPDGRSSSEGVYIPSSCSARLANRPSKNFRG